MSSSKKIRLRVPILSGVIFAVVLMSALLTSSTAMAAGSNTWTIRDDATGGDCTTIGTWDASTNTCTLTQDLNGTIGIIADGVTLDGNGHTLTGPRLNGGLIFNSSYATVKNMTIRGFWNGIVVSGGSHNTLSHNTLQENEYGIYIDASDANIVRNNNISYNTFGIYVEFSHDNTVYNNCFILNSYNAAILGGTGNAFNLPAPTGGNYWDDFDEPADGCVDNNGDGFCDAPYTFSSGAGADNLPFTLAKYSECCSKPDLRLYLIEAYWEDLSAFQSRLLSVKYSIRNVSSGSNAYEVKVTNSTATNGVSLYTPVPVLVGDIPGGSAAEVVLKYSVPPGVGSFKTSVFATALGCCGSNLYTYP
jgi:parallel beta-helix repeat protein